MRNITRLCIIAHFPLKLERGHDVSELSQTTTHECEIGVNVPAKTCPHFSLSPPLGQPMRKPNIVFLDKKAFGVCLRSMKKQLFSQNRATLGCQN